MNHNKKTLCEKIAEGFVISFLIALLVFPCEWFQPGMWAAPATYPSEAYVFDYTFAQEDISSGDESLTEAVESQPAVANPQSSTKKRKAVTTPTKSGDKTQSVVEEQQNGQPEGKVTDKDTNNDTTTEGYIINQDPVDNLPEEFPVNAGQVKPNSAIQESEILASGDSLKVIPIDTISILQSPEVKFALDSLKAVTGDSITQAFVADSLSKVDPLKRFNVWVPRELDFNPDPTRAVWLSALFPGLGQIYNRRYWKLPIVVGAYMGLAYATSWNNTMLGDYTRAYRDIMDTDPSTNSYMDFFPPTVDEASLDKTWLKNILYSRKNYFRRYRDLCIILMVGVYLLAMVDAYVDASLAHFDISQDLSMDWSPAVFHDGYAKWPSVGVSWAFNF